MVLHICANVKKTVTDRARIFDKRDSDTFKTVLLQCTYGPADQARNFGFGQVDIVINGYRGLHNFPLLHAEKIPINQTDHFKVYRYVFIFLVP